MLFTHTRTLPKLNVPQRHFWQWLNIIFNRVDESRRKLVGPDRTCAEWLLRNGGKVKWTNSDEYLDDYNHLPAEGTKRYIEEVDASDSSISHYGFDHFQGCSHITKVVLHHCGYVENEALLGLRHLSDTLKYLQVSSCHNVDEKGLQHLTVLNNLSTLLLADLPYVKDKNKIVDELKKSLIKCNITFN